MKKHPIIYLIIGFIILIVPTVIYLCFLIPQMSEEYNILMASGGVISLGGMYGASAIPNKVKFGTLYKTAAKSFTLLTAITLVEKFIMQIIGVICTFIASYIIFIIFKEIWKNARRRKQDIELAKEVAQSITLGTE